MKRNKRVILIALIVLLFLFLIGWWAAANHWGPWSKSDDKSGTNQGSGSDTSGGASTDQNAGSNSGSGGSTSGGTGAAGAPGANGSNGSNGTNGTTPPATPPAENTDAIISLSGSVNNGQTKEEVTAQAGGTNQTCTITANSTAGGKQEVCTYTQGSKVVTVTYLNDRVVNVNRTGF